MHAISGPTIETEWEKNFLRKREWFTLYYIHYITPWDVGKKVNFLLPQK